MLKVKTKELRDAVKKAKAVIRPGIHTLDTCIRFVGRKNQLMLLTNSSGVCFLTCIPCTCGEKVMDFIVNVNLLSNILPFYESEEIVLLPDKKKKMQIILEGGALRLTLATIALSAWANNKRKKEWETEISLPSEKLNELINRTSYAAFTKDTTDIRSTLNVSVTKEDVCLTCLDGYRIALCGDITGESERNFTLPVYLLKILAPFWKDTVYLRKSQDEYEIGDKNIVVWGKTPSTSFYNIDSLRRQCPENKLCLPKDEFLRLVETAALVNRTRILLSVKDGTVKVSSSGKDGKIENCINAKTTVNVSYCINPTYLVDALKKCPDEEICVYYSEKNIAPLFLKSVDHQDIILPIQQ